MSSFDEPPNEEIADQEFGQTAQTAGDSEQIDNQVEEGTANTNQQLGSDEAESLDKDNIINERTRGAKPSGGYQEPGDDEGIPTDS